ncbi:hypothetical protein Hanom_Chr00s000005g01612721 [Helianthus anomalus]
MYLCLLCLRLGVADLIFNVKKYIMNRSTKGEFTTFEHASWWLGQSVGIPGRDKSFG